MVELGVPYSDPLADGPVIQRASERALLNGSIRSRIVFKLRITHATRASSFRLFYSPIIILSCNMDLERFFQLVIEKGISGLIIPDLAD